MGKLIDLTGQKFGKLTVIKKAPSKFKQAYWYCLCECGNTSIVSGSKLKSGNTKGCKCCAKKVHGLSKTRLWNIWSSMKQRCLNKKSPAYKWYGERGIKVCNEWLNDFLSFNDWAMANGYNDTLTIDRIDTNGNYEPNNCQWVTMEKQQRNRRNNKLITYNNETHCIAEWAVIYNIGKAVLHKRIKYLGMSLEEAIQKG